MSVSLIKRSYFWSSDFWVQTLYGLSLSACLPTLIWLCRRMRVVQSCGNFSSLCTQVYEERYFSDFCFPFKWTCVYHCIQGY